MDIPRPPAKKHKKYIWPSVGVLALAAVTVGVSNLEKRAPTVPRAQLWIDSVRRGELLREVSGNGTLVPENIRWISAVTSGRVEQILVRPGASVEAGTVLMVLSNPDVQMEQLNAQRQLSAEQATLVNLRMSLETQRLQQEGAVASARAAYLEAKRQVEINEQLAKGPDKLIAQADVDRAREQLDDADTRYKNAQQQLDLMTASIPGQLRAQEEQIQRARAIAEFQRVRTQSMHVTAGASGLLTELPLEIGQWANSGATIAKVVEPGRLKAVLRIQETQAKDLALGQIAQIDTRNGIIPGHIVRMDPASQNGMVAVDVALDGPLPAGARPDLSVDGRIEIERLPDVLYMGRPTIGQAGSTVELFRLTPDGSEAERVKVTFGQTSVNAVVIKAGLNVGDKVVLSDVPNVEGQDRIRIEG
jgi:multidrug efflux pump subunit AcrA (membrane-fusion protein)